MLNARKAEVQFQGVAGAEVWLVLKKPANGTAGKEAENKALQTSGAITRQQGGLRKIRQRGSLYRR